MSARFDCADPAQLLQGLAEAETALRRGELVVIPTDTVYGIAAEAFDPVAVDGLLKAKGRGRDMPPPVLVGTVRAAMALVMELGDAGKDLIDEFWPGALTIVCMSSPTLVWDLGETKGTVAVRMPLHQVTLDLLKRTGPLAVSSANVSGRPPATTVDEAMAQLGDSVAVYLDGGPCAADVPSTIVDLTGTVPRLLRQGVISEDRLRAVIPLAVVDDDEPEDADDAPGAVAEGADDEVPPGGGDEVPPGRGDEVPPGGGDEVPPGGGDQAPPGAGDTADGAEQGNHAHRDTAG
jgi:tRNA threonylcarbamoyl adenosine modification protein (Sua5/YciO/YrdC/YwlC family)